MPEMRGRAGPLVLPSPDEEATMIDRVTGRTGSTVQDGITRGFWIATVQAFIAFTVLRWDWLETDELALLEIPITFGAMAAWGLWDRFGR